MRTALVVDDDRRALRKTVDLLTGLGYRVSTLDPGSLPEPGETDRTADLLVIDPGSRGESALRWMQGLGESNPATTCVVLTSSPTTAGGGLARGYGAHGYLAKPMTGHALGEVLDGRCRDEAQGTPSARERAPRPRQSATPRGMVVGSGPMIEVVERLRKVAPLDTTVLLVGESGTGKEVAARVLHDHHPRRKDGPLVCLHCGAIPHNLLESELFGHVRGAFTGADHDRVGKFEQANGGTLFLDEISTMSPEAQVRLLRVLQERRVTRIGSTESRPIDVRVVVASNQDLRALVEASLFRLDLFYRVNTFPVTIPPLRERPGDVPALVEFFAERVATKLAMGSPKTFSAEALRALSAHDWPGNVRELQNAVEYSVIVSDDRPEVDKHDLPPEIAGLDTDDAAGLGSVVVTEEGLDFRTAVTNLERELILQSLRLAEGNKARAAELLTLKRTTFLEKLRRLEQDGLMPA